ncbi:MAG: hypothetical protein J0L54_13370 [Chitinophagales bacterium]|nr:hypothetical protein [Chitinophagales bacterium]
MKTISIALLFISFSFAACKKSSGPGTPAKSVPTVTTFAVTNITSTSATGSGQVVSPGSSDVTRMGVAWGFQPDPVETGFLAGAGFANSGPFTCTITPLTSGKTYYYQAYAANADGWGKGAVMTFTTP